MRILQTHKFYWQRDGASNYFFYLSKLLQEAGDTVIPFSMRHPQNEKSEYDRFFVTEMDLSNPSAMPPLRKVQSVARMFYSIEARYKLQDLLSEEQIDIVHLHNIYHHISPSILPVIKKRNIPIVMTLHDYKLICPNYSLFHHGTVHEEDCVGWYSTCVKNKCMKNSKTQSRIVQAEMIFHHKFMKYYERLVDRFIAPSQFMMDLCIKYGWPREKFVHIPNPVDAAYWPLSEQDNSTVVYVGRLSEEKGLYTLLQAAKLTPDIPYVLIGTGPLEPALRAEVAKEHISNVRFAGFQTGDTLRSLISEARMVVLPSIWYENYPSSILEAKAMGKIVIGSDIGGIPELVPKNCLVTAKDPVALADTIKKWYSTPSEIRREMGVRNREEVVATNDPKEHVRTIRSLYEECIQKTESRNFKI